MNAKMQHNAKWRGLDNVFKAFWPFLIPFSFLYGQAMMLRDHLYHRGCLTVHSLPRPVISIGNLTLGGTGKTPTVIFTARLLKDAGRRPAVVSRGYRGESKEAFNVVSDSRTLLLEWRLAGDEACMLARSLPGIPVLTGRKRIDPARAAIERFYADTIVLDDAFQHLSLKRQIDIVLIDSHSGFGNGRVLPAGPMREPPAALDRADIIVITKWNEQQEPSPGEMAARIWNQRAPIFHARYCPKMLVDDQDRRFPVSSMKGIKVCAVAGLADPEHFLSTLKSLGAQVMDAALFDDHYQYPERELARIITLSKKADCLITTEKDMVKLTGRVPGLLALVVEQEIIEHEAFKQLILERIRMFEQG